MEYIATIFDLANIENLPVANGILIGNSSFAIRLTTSFNLEKHKQAKKICQTLNKKLYVLINKIFYNQELQKLEKYLSFLQKINIDGIFFSDFGVFQLAKKYKLESKCFFYHETLLRNTHDIQAYKEVGINKFVLTKDIRLTDILNIPQDLKNNVGMVVQGYFPIYYSKRKSLSHHLKVYNLGNKTTSVYQLKEKTRDSLYPIIENKNGVIIFNDQPLSYYEYIHQFSDKLSFIIIDGILENFEYVQSWLNRFYNKIEKNITDQTADLSAFSTGFLLKQVGVVK